MITSLDSYKLCSSNIWAHLCMFMGVQQADMHWRPLMSLSRVPLCCRWGIP